MESARPGVCRSTACALLLCISLAQNVLSQDRVDRATLNSGELVVTWTAADGLAVTYAGTPVFVRCAQELVVHPQDWSTAWYQSSNQAPQATLVRDGDSQILKLTYPNAGLRYEQTVRVGPGQRLEVDYRYMQDKWDDARLQLGFSRPSQDFWPGCRFRIMDGDTDREGIIPLAYDEKIGAHPFENVTDLTASSLWGSLRLKASKPIAFWDYPKRTQGFFLGFDEALPRGQDMAFTIEFVFSAPKLETAGLVVHGLRIPTAVDDGVLATQLKLSRLEAGPETVRVRLHAQPPSGDAITSEAVLRLGPEPAAIDLSVNVVQAGAHEVDIRVIGNGKDALFQSPKRTVRVAELLTIMPGKTPYTSETTADIIITPSAGLRGRTLTVTLTCNGAQVASERAVDCGVRNVVGLPLAPLPLGRSEVVCTLSADGRAVATARTTLVRVVPKGNVVTIDAVSRGLTVDGLPYFPFGFYCHYPVGSLPEQEVTQGFTHIAPYQSRPDGHSPETLAGIRAYLDRCAQLGLKVHYDIRLLAQAPASETKWAKLRAEVEAFREHPALLCWYLCDEPAGQGIEPAVLEESYRFVKDLDPCHPITIVFCVPDRAEEYLGAMDIMLADPYPIPSHPVTLVSDWTEKLRGVTKDRIPLWIVPQAFGGGEWWQREPSSREERVMTYLALIHGATGIQYFVRRAPIGNPISSSLWSECRRLSLEGAELTPWLLSTERRPEVRGNPAAVHVSAWRHDGEILVLAANTENRPRDLSLDLPEAKAAKRAHVLFENRDIDVKGGTIVEPIDAFGTRAYVIRMGTKTANDALLDPRNMTVNASFEQQANVGTPDGCYVSVGADQGASMFVDSRASRHGRHSLRITTPVEDQGLTVRPFPVRLRQEQTYRLSVWAKAKTPGLRFTLGAGGIAVKPRTFELTTDWAEYTLTGKAPKASPRAGLHFRLISAGTAWIDLLQFVPTDAE